MSFQTALEHFETAFHFTNTANDKGMEHIASGLIEMAKGLRALEKKMKSMESDLLNLR